MPGVKINTTRKKNNPALAKTEKGGLSGFLNKDLSFGSKSLGDRKKERFYSELHILLAAGIDIRTALELITEQATDELQKKTFEGIKQQVVSGSSLSETIAGTGFFSLYESFSLKIGEESGKLNEVLKELTAFYQKRIKLKRQLVNAFSYPLVVMLVAGGTIAFLLHFVVPMFTDVFKRFNSELPALTRLVIRMSASSSWIFYFLLLVTIPLTIIFITQRKKEWFRRSTSSFVMKMPLIGTLIRKIYVARLCLSMNLLLSARTPLLKSLELARNMVDFYPLEQSLVLAQKDILKGSSLHASFAGHALYDQRMISLVKVAEEVNQLDHIFSKLATQYSDEVDHQTAVLSSLIEPVMIIFLGLLVSVILIAMYLPLFQLSSTF